MRTPTPSTVDVRRKCPEGSATSITDEDPAVGSGRALPFFLASNSAVVSPTKGVKGGRSSQRATFVAAPITVSAKMLTLRIFISASGSQASDKLIYLSGTN